MFQGVEPSAVSALAKELQPVDFPCGYKFFAEAERDYRLFIIISGKVKIGRRSPDGRETLLTIMGPSDMFDELSIFDPGPRTSSATTITEVRAVSMDRETVRAWIADRPEIAEKNVAGVGPPASSHRQQPDGSDFHRRAQAIGQAAAATGAAVRHAGGRRAARYA
jgi:hypothetical protein